MERQGPQSTPVKTEAECASIDNTTAKHASDMNGGSSADPDRPTVMKHEAEHGKSVEFLQASEFVSLIKEQFPNDRDVLKKFLDILESYYLENKSVQAVYREAANLFNGHEMLLKVLPHFMPDQGQRRQG